MARPPVPRMGPIDILFLYPRSVISGTIRVPRRAVDPIEEPDSVAKAVPPATVTYDKRAGALPIIFSIALNIRVARPEWKKSSPISKNIGIGTIAKIVIFANALSVS